MTRMGGRPSGTGCTGGSLRSKRMAALRLFRQLDRCGVQNCTVRQGIEGDAGSIAQIPLRKAKDQGCYASPVAVVYRTPSCWYSVSAASRPVVGGL